MLSHAFTAPAENNTFVLFFPESKTKYTSFQRIFAPSSISPHEQWL